MCPLCMTALASGEQEVLSHVLTAHPAESAFLALLLSLGHIVLARRPLKLLAVDLSVLGLGLYLSRRPFRSR